MVDTRLTLAVADLCENPLRTMFGFW